jgi:hypothetical protein
MLIGKRNRKVGPKVYVVIKKKHCLIGFCNCPFYEELNRLDNCSIVSIIYLPMQ